MENKIFTYKLIKDFYCSDGSVIKPCIVSKDDDMYIDSVTGFKFHPHFVETNSNFFSLVRNRNADSNLNKIIEWIDCGYFVKITNDMMETGEYTPIRQVVLLDYIEDVNSSNISFVAKLTTSFSWKYEYSRINLIVDKEGYPVLEFERKSEDDNPYDPLYIEKFTGYYEHLSDLCRVFPICGIVPLKRGIL